MTQSTTAERFYRAVYIEKWGQPDAPPTINVYYADFERKPKSWRRVGGYTDNASNAFGYKTVFDKGIAPGFKTPFEAIDNLIEQTAKDIEHKETTLRRLRTKLEYAQTFKKNYQDSTR